MSRDNRYAPVGATVYNAYWQYVYRVLSHNADGSVTVVMLDHERTTAQWYEGGPGHSVGSVWSHRTPLDRRDTILSNA